MTMRFRRKTGPWGLGAIFTLALMLPPSVHAQGAMDALEQSTPQERAALQTAFMKSKLALDEKQSGKVSALNLEYAEKAEPIIKGDDGIFSKRSQMNSLQDEKNAKLKGILTPDQYETYEAAQDELRDQMVEGIEKRLKEKAGS
jgi:hypothetical protein